MALKAIIDRLRSGEPQPEHKYDVVNQTDPDSPNQAVQYGCRKCHRNVVVPSGGRPIVFVKGDDFAIHTGSTTPDLRVSVGSRQYGTSSDSFPARPDQTSADDAPYDSAVVKTLGGIIRGLLWRREAADMQNQNKPVNPRHRN